MLEPLLEAEFEFKRYQSWVKLNFTPKCMEMLNSVDQIKEIITHCKK